MCRHNLNANIVEKADTESVLSLWENNRADEPTDRSANQQTSQTESIHSRRRRRRNQQKKIITTVMRIAKIHLSFSHHHRIYRHQFVGYRIAQRWRFAFCNKYFEKRLAIQYRCEIRVREMLDEHKIVFDTTVDKPAVAGAHTDSPVSGGWMNGWMNECEKERMQWDTNIEWNSRLKGRKWNCCCDCQRWCSCWDFQWLMQP